MNRIIKIFSLLLIAFFTVQCATQVMPDGGQRDTSPPEVVKMNPPTASTNFKSDKIEIEFDEYVVLDNINNNLLISPLMAEKPKITIKGKSVIIKLPDSLKPNTTYSFFFGEGVKNYKENTPAENLSYVFSTGDKIDSLKIEGKLISAFDNEAVTEAYVLLYKNDYDSIVSKELPDYISKVNEDGKFELKNIANEKYKIFAIKDMNNNYLFDQISEEVAFLDSLLVPKERIIMKRFDSIKQDTIIKKAMLYPKVELKMFKQEADKQIVVTDKLVSASHVSFVFKKSLQNLEIKSLYNDDIENAYKQISKNKDSLDFWFDDNLDSVKFVLSDNSLILDTFDYKFKDVDTTKNLKRLTYNFKRQLDFYRDIKISSINPIKLVDTSQIKLQIKNDSVYNDVKFNYEIEESTGKLVLKPEFEQKQIYKLKLHEGAITDFYGRINDSITKDFSTSEKKIYSNLIFTFNNIDSIDVILQLISSKGDIVSEYAFNTTKEIDFGYLKPGKYKIKLIIDNNANKKWDSGNYYNKVFPEKIFFFNKEVDLKANWENSEKWDFKLE